MKNDRFTSVFVSVFLFALTLIAAHQLSAQTKDYTKYVNPFIGTGGHGHTFPGATVPFGMVQLSPDTRIDNWDGSSGYHYSDNEIFGFSHTHLSGTGIPDYCDVLLMPTVGKVDLENFKTTFSHANERAEPGYYTVTMDNGVKAELTATARVGLHRYSFPQNAKRSIVLDLKWRDKVLASDMKIVSKTRVEGFRRSSSWAKDQIVYYVIEFSEPFETLDRQFRPSVEKRAPRDEDAEKAAFRFADGSAPISVKVGISAVDVDGARKNLAAELPGWDFEKVRSDAKALWNKELGSIEVQDSNTENLAKFYSALYHTKIQPNIFQDVDGRFRGLDGKTYSAKPDEYYTIFSLWDTFRAAHPLYTIIDEKRTVDFINTMIAHYEIGGRLPVWELAGNETDTMIGYHSVSVIADAMAKGIKGFDYNKAFEAARNSAELDHFGLEAYKRRGYISMEDENESVSKTLEYAYNDFCIAVMAKIVGDTEQHQKYLKRARFYKNHFDQETGFMRPRQNGGFVSPFKPNEVTFHFTEGNSWVYSFFVPQDVNGLIDLYGSKAAFSKKLDGLFTTDDKLTGRVQPDITGLIGQYAHGNEPSHHIAYLYNYAGEPWKAQKLVHQINNEFYKNAPDGLIGNEDCGQMSAWFILSAMGFYQVNPSVAVYDLGTPLFREAAINLENGKRFTVRAKSTVQDGAPLPPYVKSVRLNGRPHRKTSFTHADIMNGGVLEFELTDEPNKTWFNEFSTSRIEGSFVTVPIIDARERVFKTSTTVTIRSNSKDDKILFSTDGSEPKTEYKQAFTVDRSMVVKSLSVNSKGERSLIVESKLNRLPHDWTVKITSKYNTQYTGGGDTGLIDGIRGTTNFASGEWQGYQDQDFVATVDMQRETEIKSLGAGFLQVARSWIWMPTRIDFEVSSDNLNFRKVAEITTDVSVEDMEHRIRDYSQKITPTRARYVRVKAVNLGKIPAWHPGAGFEAFIFVDEIFID